MEPFVFLIGVVMLMLWTARDRIGGRSRTPSEQRDFEAHRPINYGEFVAPPGTAPSTGVDAPFFRSDHSGQDRQSHGADE